MHPERVDWVHSLSMRSLRFLAEVSLALMFIACGAAWPANSAPGDSASQAYDSESFIKELGRLKMGLDQAEQSTEVLRTFREALPNAWTVDAGGRRYDVHTDLLRSRLVKAERQPDLRGQQLDEAREYLDALAAETASLSGQPPASTNSARSKLAAILIAYWIFRNWFRGARVQEMALQAAAVPSRSWQEWVFAAREAAGRGDFRMAIHCAYWGAIARLQELGTLDSDRAKTPREYLRALTKSKRILPETLASRHQALSVLTSRLEKIWYGYQIATEADFRESLTQLETLGCHLP